MDASETTQVSSLATFSVRFQTDMCMEFIEKHVMPGTAFEAGWQENRLAVTVTDHTLVHGPEPLTKLFLCVSSFCMPLFSPLLPYRQIVTLASVPAPFKWLVYTCRISLKLET